MARTSEAGRVTTKHRPAVMWIELFQDLVVVVIVTALAEGLIKSWGHPWMIWYSFAMLALYGAWSTMVLLNERFPSNSLPRQILAMVWMVGGLLVAGGALYLNWLEPAALNVGAAFMLGSASVSYFLAGRGNPHLRTTTAIVTTSTGLGALIALVSAPFPASDWLLLPAVLIALVPAITTYLAKMPGSVVTRTDHLVERFGQFMLILLGAMFLEVLLGIRDGRLLAPFGLAVGITILFLLFRAYFQHLLPLGVPTDSRRIQAWIGVQAIMAFGFAYAAVAMANVSTYVEGDDPHAAGIDQIPAILAGASVGMSLCIAYVGMALVALVADRPSRALAALYGLTAVAMLLTDGLLRSFTDLAEVWRTGFLLIVAVVTGLISTRIQYSSNRTPVGEERLPPTHNPAG